MFSIEGIKSDLSQRSLKLVKSRSLHPDENQSATKAKKRNGKVSQESPGKKRSINLECSQSSNKTKKAKVQVQLDDGWGVRPRRATQQVRDDMPFKECIENTPNYIGKNVIRYDINAEFRLKSITTDADKAYCIGQIIAVELVKSKGHRWAVKQCPERDDDRKWDFVCIQGLQQCQQVYGGSRRRCSRGEGKVHRI